VKDLMKTIRTSEKNWLRGVATCYRTKTLFYLDDDAELGIDPVSHSIVDMGRLSGLSLNDWMAVFVNIGLCGIGVRMVAAAILDPEPTSKLGLLIASGTLLVVTGGVTIVRILTGLLPPKVKVNGSGFVISWV
jgi:hypothetical protein